MVKLLYRVKGPAGNCVMSEAQAKEKEKIDGWEIIDSYDPIQEANIQANKKAEAKLKAEKKVEEVEEGDNELLDELKSIRSNADLASFIEENEIEIDPADYDGFKEIKEAVAEILGA